MEVEEHWTSRNICAVSLEKVTRKLTDVLTEYQALLTKNQGKEEAGSRYLKGCRKLNGELD